MAKRKSFLESLLGDIRLIFFKAGVCCLINKTCACQSGRCDVHLSRSNIHESSTEEAWGAAPFCSSVGL